MFKTGVLLSIALFLHAAAPAETKVRASNGKGGAAGTFANEHLTVNESVRDYRLIVPANEKPMPLIFAFHGLGDSKDLMPVYSQLPALAQKHKCIVVFPNGKNKSWPLVPAIARDDLAFFDALYAEITSKYNVDLDRVYLTGMSNGAFFTHVVASQRSDKVAAIAAHCGGMGVIAIRQPKISHKYAVMAINGDADPLVKVEEGRKTRDIYKSRGHEVEYVELPGHGHLWNGLSGINEKMWAFFEAHPMKANAAQ